MSDPLFTSTLASTSGNALSPVAQLMDMGGPVMLVLLALAGVGLVAFFYLMLTGALLAPRLTPELRKVVKHWQQQPGRPCCERLQTCAGWYARLNPLRKLALFAMTQRLESDDPELLKGELTRQAQTSLQPFEAPLKIIEVIAALAPLLGLLGTVMGMMTAFDAMAQSTGQGGASQLSGGIYEALTTTAAGLIVAIPFSALAAWIEFRLKRMGTTVNDTLVRLMTTQISTHGRSGDRTPTRGYQTITSTQPQVAHAAG